MDYFFKSQGHAYVYFLTTFTGSQLYRRLNISYKHYQNKQELTLLIDKIKNLIVKNIEEKFTREGYQDFFLIHKLPHIQKVLEARYDFFDDKEQSYELFLFSLKKYFNI